MCSTQVFSAEILELHSFSLEVGITALRLTLLFSCQTYMEMQFIKLAFVSTWIDK